jgi:hypothetical protein
MKSIVSRGMLSIFQSSKSRQLVVLFLVLILGWTTISCGESNVNNSVGTPQNTKQAQQNRTNTAIADGKYDVQQATYDDGDGLYTLFLLNTPPSVPATFRTDKLQMAQLTPEEVTANKPAYLDVKSGQAALHIPKDFKLEYVHNVAEKVENPQTGQTETRIVRQESNFWTPFAGALAGQVAGQAIGSLFAPRHYVPPMYQSGGLFGYGGYGNSYGQAVDSYRQRYQAPPVAERNRTVYRTTRRTNTGFGSATPRSSFGSSSSQRSTGTGFGSSNLRRSNSSSSYRRAPSSGFGSGRSSGSRSFGSRRR